MASHSTTSPTQVDHPAHGTTIAGRLPESPLAEVLAHPHFPPQGWTRRSLNRGDVLLREGEDTGAVYLVLDGQVRVEGTVRMQSGRQFQAGVAVVGPGSVIGELALFDAQPHSATAVAESDVTVAVLARTTLRTFLDAHPTLGYRVFGEFLAQLAVRLRATNARVYKFLAWGLKAYQLDK